MGIKLEKYTGSHIDDTEIFNIDDDMFENAIAILRDIQNSTIIVIPHNVDRVKFASINGIRIENLPDELNVLRVMRNALANRMEKVYDSIPKFEEK